jgi:uncharacterized membrane protein
MALLSLAVAAYAAFLVAADFAYLSREVASNAFASPHGLRIHIAASAVALALGPFQFLKVLRTNAPWLHRWMGRFYVTACLFGGLAGAMIAMFTSQGIIAGSGFLSLAILWLLLTARAFLFVLKRDFESHERWMVRSFALTLAAVTLRIYLPIGVTLNNGEFTLPYTIIAWACWIPNLILAEIWLAVRHPRNRATA